MKAIQCPLCNGTGAYEILPTGSSLSMIEEDKEMLREMVLDFFNSMGGKKNDRI